jgi:hypothetical protein
MDQENVIIDWGGTKLVLNRMSRWFIHFGVNEIDSCRMCCWSWRERPLLDLSWLKRGHKKYPFIPWTQPGIWTREQVPQNAAAAVRGPLSLVGLTGVVEACDLTGFVGCAERTFAGSLGRAGWSCKKLSSLRVFFFGGTKNESRDKSRDMYLTGDQKLTTETSTNKMWPVNDFQKWLTENPPMTI